MEATNGEGIDVILNSLIGDLLDASWRIIADGGTMVEIGKKDIIDRNSLSMEPFGRNASFRALDFSYKEISDALIAEYVLS
jgi:NADPH:quinone reductase-like Zn-dependent oxidoreductase